MTSEKLTELLNGAFDFGERYGQTADLSWREDFAIYTRDNIARLSREPHPDTMALDEIKEAVSNANMMMADVEGISTNGAESIAEARRILGDLQAAIAAPRRGLCPGCTDKDCLGSARPELCTARAQDAGRGPHV